MVVTEGLHGMHYYLGPRKHKHLIRGGVSVLYKFCTRRVML